MTDSNYGIHGDGIPSSVTDSGVSGHVLDAESGKEQSSERDQATTGPVADAHRNDNHFPPFPSLDGELTEKSSQDNAHSSLMAKQQEAPHRKQLDKLARHVPPSLDLSYITPQIIGMAPPRSKYPDNGHCHIAPPISPGTTTKSSLQMALHKTSKTKKQSHENDPAELSSFLEQRHSRRYLLFNVSDEDVDDRTLLLLGRQVVHLPWGSPRLNTNASQLAPSSSFECANSNECPVSPTPSHTRDSSRSSGINIGRDGAGASNNKSSQTPAVSRVMEICYAMHSYLTTSALRGKRSTVACVYCSNGKTRTGVVAACYLRFANKVRDAMSGFELFCERRGISPGLHQQHGERDMSGHIPPSLRQFFRNFDEVVELRRYPHPEPLLLQFVRLQGVPVDDMPCIDIWEHGDVARHQIYSSHDDVTLNEWDDDEGSYNIGQILNRDFTLVCRFGGKFAQDADDPTKVLFRYVNSTKFLKEGRLELRMESVDMMRRYADSFDEEDFFLTLEFESIEDDNDKFHLRQKKKLPFASGLRFDPGRIGDRVLEGMDSILHGWRVISESHLSHVSTKTEEDLGLESSFFTLTCFGSEIDFRHIALQLTNGDIDLAKEELIQGLFGALFTYDDGFDEFGGSNYVHEAIETAFSMESAALSERQKSIDEESYFTANDDEIEEETCSEPGVEERPEDNSCPLPQSHLENESTFSDPGLTEICGNDASEHEEKTVDAFGLVAEESTPDDSSDTLRESQTQDLSPRHDDMDVGLDASVPNTPFADRSRSSLLEAIKLRGLGKSLTSVGINNSRSSLLKEITESALKRHQVAEDCAEPFPNVPFYIERCPTRKGDVESFSNDVSPKSSVGDIDCESVTSDGAVISPVPTAEDIVERIKSRDTQQPYLDDVEKRLVHEEQEESRPISSLAAAATKVVKSINDVECERRSELLSAYSESHFHGSKQTPITHLNPAHDDGDEGAVNATQEIPQSETQQSISIVREQDESEKTTASNNTCVQLVQMRVCTVETEGLESLSSVNKNIELDQAADCIEKDITVLNACPGNENLDKDTAKANENFGPLAVQCSLNIASHSKQHTSLGSETSDTINSELDTGQSISSLAEKSGVILETLKENISAAGAEEMTEATVNEKAEEDTSDPRSALIAMLSKRVSLRNKTPEKTKPVKQVYDAGNEKPLTALIVEECPKLGATDYDDGMTLDNRAVLMAMLPKQLLLPVEESHVSLSNCDGITLKDAGAGNEQSLDSKAESNPMLSNCYLPEIQDSEPTLPINAEEVDSSIGESEEVYDPPANAKEPEIGTLISHQSNESKNENNAIENKETPGPDSTYSAMLLKQNHSLITQDSKSCPLNEEGIESIASGDDNEIIQQYPKTALRASVTKCNSPSRGLNTPSQSSAEGLQVCGDDSGMEEIQQDSRAELKTMLSKPLPPSDEPIPWKSNDGVSKVDVNHNEMEETQPDSRAALLVMFSKRNHPPIHEPESTESSGEGLKRDVYGNEKQITGLDPRAAFMDMQSNRSYLSREVPKPPKTNAEGSIVVDNAKTISNNEYSMVDVNCSETDETQLDSVHTIALSNSNPSSRGQTKPFNPDYESSKMGGDIKQKEKTQPVTRAAPLTTLSHHNHPSSDDSEPAKTEAACSKLCSMEDTLPDPRAALIAMLSKRSQPATDKPVSTISSHASPKGDGYDTESEKSKQDPRAALMAMLSKRNPAATAAEPEPAKSNYDSAKGDDNATEIEKRLKVDCTNKEIIKLQPDSRAALMPMLSKRNSNVNDNGNLVIAKDDDSNAEVVEKENNTTHLDPRAALMAMLSKHSPPSGDKSEPLKLHDEGSKLVAGYNDNGQTEPEAESVVMAVLSKRNRLSIEGPDSPACEVSTKFHVDDHSPDTRALRTFLLNKNTTKNYHEVQNDTSSTDDSRPPGSTVPRPPVQSTQPDDETPLNKDPKYEKYFRMLKMGLPMGAVQNAMQRDGLDPAIMDLDPNKSVASQMKNDHEGGPPLKDDPKYQKYFRMLKMGLPMGAVQNAMQRDGLDPTIMDLDPNKSVSSQLKKEEDDGPPLQDDPKYQKYFKGLPMGAVQNAMQRDGLDPTIMNLDPDKSVASQLKKQEDDGPPLKDDPKYQKYFKMLKMGLPLGAVKNALQRDGLDPTIMDLDHDKSLASQQNEEEKLVDNGPKLKDDPKYQKYFKMLKMGLPIGAVKNALQRDGLNPEIMDLDPEKSEEYQKAVASRKKLTLKKASAKEPKKPKVRRKKIYWRPIEESKIDDNSLWSMIKGSFDFDSLKFDQDEFESLFTDTSNPEDKKKIVSEKTSTSKQKKSVQVIDAKRGMNGGIILARLKIDFPVLAEMVNNMDSGKLDDTQLKALLEFLPSQEEKAAIEQYIKDASSTEESKQAAMNDFCACEKYMHAMMKVEKADKKFECMLFKYQFEHKLNELMDGVTTLINACEEVQKSVRLRKLMAMILMLGNQINTGGSGRIAHGFTLDALLKLDEAKAFDKKTSVLQYLVKLVKVNEPDLLKVHAEMPSIGPAESVIVDGLISELKDLSERLKNVKETAIAEGIRYRVSKAATQTGTALDRLKHQRTKIKEIEGVNMYNQTEYSELTPMEKFVAYAEKRTAEALARTDEVQELFKGVLTYFGEDPAMTSTDFFGTLNKFVGALDAAFEVVKRLEAQKAAEEKKAAAQRAREEAKKAQASPENVVESKHDISNLVIERGKLDLSGQRKQYADPFPDTAQQTSPQFESNRLPIQRKQFADPFVGPSHPEHFHSPDKNTTHSKISPKSLLTKTCFSETSPEKLIITPATSPGGKSTSTPNDSPIRSPSMRFFPATSPGESKKIITSRSERYNQKTSSSARTINKYLETTSYTGKNKTEDETEGTKQESRSALIAMLSKRNAPPRIMSETNVSSEKDRTVNSTNNLDKEDAQPNPRAALMAMLSRRNPISTEEPVSALLAKKGDDRKIDADKVEENKAPKPSEGLSKCKPPLDVGSDTNDSAGKCSSVDTPENLDEKDDQPDPRAALMAMLSRHNPSSPSSTEEPVSTLRTNKGLNRKVHADDDVEQMVPDWSEARNSMLSKCKSPQDVGSKTNDSAAKCSSVDTTDDDKKDAQQDPRAALMAMLSRRNPPSTEEPGSALFVSKGDDRKDDADKVQEKEAPKPSEGLSKCNSPSDVGPETNESAGKCSGVDATDDDGKDAPPDPRAALLAMLSRRNPPFTEEPVSALLPKKGDDRKVDADKDKEKDAAKPSEGLSKCKSPPTGGRWTNDSAGKGTAVDSTNNIDEKDDQPDPRAALMAMLSRRNPPSTEESLSIVLTNKGLNRKVHADEVVKQAVPDWSEARNSMLSKRKSRPDVGSKTYESAGKYSSVDATDDDEKDAQQDPRAALMAMLSRRNPPSTEEPVSALLAKKGDERKVDADKVKENKAPKPSEGLSNRTSPPTSGRGTNDSAGKCSSVDTPKNLEEKDDQPDPSAALMAMHLKFNNPLTFNNPSLSKAPESFKSTSEGEVMRVDAAYVDKDSSLITFEGATDCDELEDRWHESKVAPSAKKVLPAHDSRFLQDDQDSSTLCLLRVNTTCDVLADKISGLDTENEPHSRNTTLFATASNIEERRSVINEPSRQSFLTDGSSENDCECNGSTLNRNEIHVDGLSDKSSASRPKSIAAMAAAAARNKNHAMVTIPKSSGERKSHSQFSPMGPSAPMGIAAMAAAAARQKMILQQQDNVSNASKSGNGLHSDPEPEKDIYSTDSCADQCSAMHDNSCRTSLITIPSQGTRNNAAKYPPLIEDLVESWHSETSATEYHEIEDSSTVLDPSLAQAAHNSDACERDTIIHIRKTNNFSSSDSNKDASGNSEWLADLIDWSANASTQSTI
ncbi:hypothetical protein ACHAW6_015582 [Cyclotella cf. meneghiniana]